jgi:probable phosphoglycerate mutase
VTASSVLLWRHGQTSYNQQRRFQGQSDVPLDRRGQDQAEAAAVLLAGRLTGVGPVRIVSSDLSRAWMTADALAARLSLVTEREPALREIAAGNWEGLLRPEIKGRWPAEFRAWRRGEDVPVGGQERRSEAAARTADAVRRHAEAMDGGVLVAVSHGGCLRVALPLLLDLVPGQVPGDGAGAVLRDRFGVLRNARWAELEVGPGPWKLVTYNHGVPEAPTGESGDVADDGQTVMDGDGSLDDPAAGGGRILPGRGASVTDLEPAALATIDSLGRDGEIV